MKNMLRLLFAGLVALSLVWGADEDEIRAAEKKWADALVHRDLAALEKMYTSDLIYAHSTGKIENVKQYIGRLSEGKQVYTTVTHENTRVVVYGNSAVAHSIARTVGKNDAGPFDDHLMMMHLWVKQSGVWRLAAHQTTKIP